VRYAQILYDKAHWIFESDETLEQLRRRFATEIVFVDITDSAEVQEGWDYNGVFTAPSGLAVEERLAALDAEYNPQFDALTLAWATASMDGDTETANARLADKQTLKAEYQQKREAIIHG
jgi:hypothetical protein